MVNSHKYLIVAAVIVISVICDAHMSAKNRRVPKLYAFGVAASFNDSIVYFTNIQEMDSVWINDKNDFLLNRNDYSYQLKNYLEAQGHSRRTCFVSYALKRKDAEKKYMKMRNKYARRGSFDIRYIDNKDFEFIPVDMD